MRIAFVGKGGAGKSAVAGTFARLLARTGERVLALDSDPLPGLAFSLGVERSDAGLPDEAVEEYDDPTGRRRYRLRSGMSGPAALEAYAAPGPDGVRFLQLGKARGLRWENSRQHFGYQCVLDDLPADGWSVVGDLPGGTRQPFLTWGRYAETFVVVVEPTPASLLTARRLARLTGMPGSPAVVAVANKVRETADLDRVAAGTGLPVVGWLPFDAGIVAAERHGEALLDREPTSPAVAAVRSLVQTLLAGTESS